MAADAAACHDQIPSALGDEPLGRIRDVVHGGRGIVLRTGEGFGGHRQERRDEIQERDESRHADHQHDHRGAFQETLHDGAPADPALPGRKIIGQIADRG